MPPDTGNIADFIGVVEDWLSFVNAIRLANEASRLITDLLNTVPCGIMTKITICFDEGPPPRDLTVTLSNGAIAGNPCIHCGVFTYKGTQGCQ